VLALLYKCYFCNMKAITIKAHLALITVNLLYGANYIVAKEIMPTHIQAFGFIVIRVSMVTVLLWLFHRLMCSVDNNEKLKRPIGNFPLKWLGIAFVTGLSASYLFNFSMTVYNWQKMAYLLIPGLPALAYVGFVLYKIWLYYAPNERGKIAEFNNWELVLACGIFGVAINQLLFFKGLSLTSSINASLIMITTPILVLLIAAFLINEAITKWKLVGIFLGCVGAGTIIALGGDNLNNSSRVLGDMCIFFNATSYAMYLVIVKPLMKKYHAFTLLKWLFLFGFFLVLPVGWNEFWAIEWANFTPSVWAALIYVVVGSTFFTYLLNIYALQHVNASVVSTYIYTQPVIATTIAVSLGKDSLSLEKVIAALAIFAGVYLVSSRK